VQPQRVQKTFQHVHQQQHTRGNRRKRSPGQKDDHEIFHPNGDPLFRKTEKDAERTRRRKNKTQKEPDARLDARLATIEEEKKIDLIKQEVDEVDEVTGRDRQQ
jgi:2-methylcitrate dehydratase PrpD